jgi:phage repressor protein C with HTH and peptisase S24 domain
MCCAVFHYRLLFQINKGSHTWPHEPILFLQQLGRGLRRHAGKERLVVLDFIGNHQGFLNKPQALFDVGSRYRDLAAFARQARDGQLKLPPGCYANYDLAIIDFLIRLQGRGPDTDYQALKDSLGRRPTLTEFYRSGSHVSDLRRRHRHWWALVDSQADLTAAETDCLTHHADFLCEVETTAMTKSFKAVLLESMIELDGFRHPPRIEDLAAKALEVFRRRRRFIADIRDDLRDLETIAPGKWLAYWKGNPINAWTGGNQGAAAKRWFEVRDGRFQPTFHVTDDAHEAFQRMVQELVDYRLAAYEPRLSTPEPSTTAEPVAHSAAILPFRKRTAEPAAVAEIPYFPDLRIACGHFRSGRTDADASCRIGPGFGRLDPARHFVARAVGNSMNGGKQPVQDGDYLLLELIDPSKAGSITGNIMVIERQGMDGEDQYLLRVVHKNSDGRYILKATNPDYPDYEADEGMRTLARLMDVLKDEDIVVL